MFKKAADFSVAFFFTDLGKIIAKKSAAKAAYLFTAELKLFRLSAYDIALGFL